MKRLALYGGLVAVLLVAVGIAALAAAGDTGTSQRQVKSDTLTGYQEGPAISTTGTGSFEAVIDDDSQMVTYTLTYSALENDAAQAHIHLGKRAENGGVIAFLCGGGDKPACPLRAGTVTGVIDPADVIGPAGQGIEAGSFGELLRALRSGNTYLNVHTSRFPGGEIRAQINDSNQRETG